MKPVQVMFDENLLRQLDADAEVQRDGRSAVLRRAAAEYLRRRRNRRIKAAYESAYGPGDVLADEFSGWVRERSWPDASAGPAGSRKNREAVRNLLC